MQLKQLHQFSAIADCGSIAQAAKLLYISQPALTTSIKNLERELGVSLFHRTSQGISLTSEGRYTLEIARQMMALEQKLLKHFSEDPYANYEGIRIMSLPYVKDSFLSDHIAQFYEIFPHKTLEISCASIDAITQHLAAGDIDFGFSAQIYCEGTPLFDAPLALNWTPFYTTKYFAVLSPLCNLNQLSSISLASLLRSNYRLLLLKGANLRADAVTKILEHYHLAADYVEVDSFNLLESFLERTPSFFLTPNIEAPSSQKWKWTALTNAIVCHLQYGIAPQAGDNPFLQFFTEQLKPTKTFFNTF